MLNPIEKNSECQFAEHAVSYLYGETNASDKFKFEKHLKSCAQCADDLAGFGIIRSNIIDWKTENFASLETPTFVIPQNKSSKSESVSEETNSWFDIFTRIFQLKPALAAFAVLIVFAGVMFVSFNFSNKNNVVADAVPISKEPVIEPTIEITENKLPINPVIESEQPQKLNVIKVKSSQALPKTKKAKITNSKPVFVKLSINSRNSSDKISTAVNENFAQQKKTNSIRNQSTPKLVETEEEEDTTVRLADLFDEIDTK